MTLVFNAYVQLVAAYVRLRRLNARELVDGGEAGVLPAAARSVEEEARLVARAVRALALAERAFPAHVTCLQRSVALQRLLDPLGIATRIRIGVRKAPDELKAHAWLEYRGRALDSSPALNSQFQPLHPLPREDEPR